MGGLFGDPGPVDGVAPEARGTAARHPCAGASDRGDDASGSDPVAGDNSPWGTAQGGMSVQADLEQFAALLKKWNAVQNLVSRETVDELWPRHIEDSLQLAENVHGTDRHIVDIGSGGGFPTIPLAIASRDTE